MLNHPIDYQLVARRLADLEEFSIRLSAELAATPPLDSHEDAAAEELVRSISKVRFYLQRRAILEFPEYSTLEINDWFYD